MGTACDQWDDRNNNFTNEPDECKGNVIRSNWIKTNVRAQDSSSYRNVIVPPHR